MSRLSHRVHVSHAEVVAQAKARPGEWVRVGAYRSAYTAKSTAHAIRVGRRDMTVYAPLGAYETRTAPCGFDTELHVRYQSEGVPSC